MSAAVDREPDAAAPEPLDLAALRRELMTELRNQLRTDFERGG